MLHRVSLRLTFVVCAAVALWLNAGLAQAQMLYFTDGFTANDNTLWSVLPSGVLGPPVTLVGLPSDVPRHDMTLATTRNISALWVLSSSDIGSGAYYLTLYPRNPFTGGVAGPPIVTNIPQHNGAKYGLDFGGGYFWILENTRPATIYQVYPATGALFNQVHLSAYTIHNLLFEDVAFDGLSGVTPLLWVVGDSGVCCGLPAIVAIDPSTGAVVSGPTNLSTLSAGAGYLSKRITRITLGANPFGVLWLLDTAGTVPAIYAVAANGMILTPPRYLAGFPHVPSVTEMGIAFGCAFSIPTSISFPSGGGPGTLSLTTSPGCAWEASSPNSWITTSSTGAGSGILSFSVATNTTGAPRTGTIAIGGLTVTVSQAGTGGPCAISPTSALFQASGGSGSVTVTGDGCSWTAKPNNSWITIANGGSGSAPGHVDYSVTATTFARVGSISINDLTFTVSQFGLCPSAVTPARAWFDVPGSSGSFSVSADGVCSWTATSDVSWITITGGSGSGRKTVAYSVSPNPTTANRTGHIVVTGAGVNGVTRTYTVDEAGIPCPGGISPLTASLAASGGPGAVSVTAGAVCSWTATSTPTWIVITSGSSGSGNGTVGYTVSPNTATSPRSGTIKINNSIVNVYQERFCAYSISPASRSFSEYSHSGSVGVTTDAGCSWSATSNASWMTITSGSSGSGAGTVKYSVSANRDNGSRTGTLTIAGQTFTVTQAGTCATFSISPASQSFSSSGGSGGVVVTAGAGCSWTVSGNASWNTITSPTSGVGNGTATYSVAANPHTYSRTDRLTIAGQTFTVTQAGR